MDYGCGIYILFISPHYLHGLWMWYLHIIYFPTLLTWIMDVAFTYYLFPHITYMDYGCGIYILFISPHYLHGLWMWHLHITYFTTLLTWIMDVAFTYYLFP